MSWIIVPCSDLPENSTLSDYFDKICKVPEEQQHELNTLVDVLAMFDNLSDGMAEIGQDFAYTSLIEVCEDEPPAQAEAFDVVSPERKTQITDIFALRPAWLFGVYSQFLVGEEDTIRLSEGLIFPVGNRGYETMNCITYNPELDFSPSAPTMDFDCGFIVRNDALARQNQFILVAAGGNEEQYAFPYLPAVWDSVLSVGASNYDSNYAEIRMNGESTFPDPVDVWKGGSSFAAPRMSVWGALYLLQTGSARCPRPTKYANNMIDSDYDPSQDVYPRPVLGVKENWNRLDLSLKNMPLYAAADDCADFADLID
jgi:hypothetical protein